MNDTNSISFSPGHPCPADKASQIGVVAAAMAHPLAPGDFAFPSFASPLISVQTKALKRQAEKLLGVRLNQSFLIMSVDLSVEALLPKERTRSCSSVLKYGGV